MSFYIHFDEILIENRQRRDFDADNLTDLANSIEKYGLFHAPVVKVSPDGVRLVAGERRLRAMKMLHKSNRTFSYNNERVDVNTIPYTDMDDLDEVSYREAELEENVQRVDLSWQEKAKAVATLDELRKLQDPQWNTSDTAEEIYGNRGGYFHSVVSNAKILSDHMDDPYIAKAPSTKEALKRIERKSRSKMNSALIELFEPETQHVALLGDCRKHWKDISDVDVIITDPPYGVGANKFHEQATTPHNYADSEESGAELNLWLAEHAHEVCKPAAALYLFCDIRNFETLKELYTSNGWKVWSSPIIWYKGSSGMLPEPNYGPRKTYEAVLYAYRGGKQVAEQGALDVILNAQHEKDRMHGAQKSVASYVNLLKRHVTAGDHVCDPFMGSGTIYPSCNQLGCRATGIESLVENFNHAKLRIEDHD